MYKEYRECKIQSHITLGGVCDTCRSTKLAEAILAANPLDQSYREVSWEQSRQRKPHLTQALWRRKS